MIVLVNFSNRKNGNCTSIADNIGNNHFNEELKIFNFGTIKATMCGNCNYECFKENQICLVNDEINDIYNAIIQSTLTIFIIPNYCGYPCANYFLFNERGCGFFNKSQELLDKYTSIKKKFIVISNTDIANIKEILRYQVLDDELDILLLSAKKFNRDSFNGDLMENNNVKNLVIDFALPFKAKIENILFEFSTKFTKIEFIDKGWSSDEKYYVETLDNKAFVLRVFDIAEYNRKKIEYDALCKAYKHGINVPTPKEFGVFKDRTKGYYIVSWLDGVDIASKMISLTEEEKYLIGYKAGELLRKIHNIPAPSNIEPWHVRFQRKIDERLASYYQNNVKSVNGEKAVKYLNDNIDLLKNRIQTFKHGDFNTTNIIVSSNGEVGVIDFNSFYMTSAPSIYSDYGDPLFELICISYMEDPDSHYYTGLWNGYTNDNPNKDFFKILSIYFAYDVIASLCGGADCGFDNGEFDQKVMNWYNDFNQIIPSWYIKDCIKKN